MFLHRNYNLHVYSNRITGAEVKMYKVQKANFVCRTQGAVQESSDFQTLNLKKCWSNPPWPCALKVLCSKGPAVLEACCWRRCNSLYCSSYGLFLWFAWHSLKISWIRAYSSECFKGSPFFYFRTFPKVSQPSGGKAHIWVTMFLP